MEMTVEFETHSTAGLVVAGVSLAWIWFASWFVLGAVLCGAL